MSPIRPAVAAALVLPIVAVLPVPISAGCVAASAPSSPSPDAATVAAVIAPFREAVNDIVVTDGGIYVAGAFRNAGGVRAADYIAR